MFDLDICQSCALPLDENNRGTNGDFTESEEYCKFCYANGEFTEPYLTLSEMIGKSVSILMTELNYPESKARELAEHYVPELKRWQSAP